jgi:hypothetical protein
MLAAVTLGGIAIQLTFDCVPSPHQTNLLSAPRPPLAIQTSQRPPEQI